MAEPAPPHRQPQENPRHGRLTARPTPPTALAAAGRASLTDPQGAPLAMVYAPAPVDGPPYRLVLLLHGAGGSARQGLDLLLPVADTHRLLLVAPQAASSSWDLIVEGFGVDVRRIDALLATTFAGYPVAEVAFGGFSDGASYALSLGLTNGDLVDAVVAFSPASPRRWSPTAGPGSTSRTAPTTRSCRSTCAAAAWSPGCARWATTSPTTSSRAPTSFLRTSAPTPPPG